MHGEQCMSRQMYFVLEASFYPIKQVDRSMLAGGLCSPRSAYVFSPPTEVQVFLLTTTGRRMSMNSHFRHVLLRRIKLVFVLISFLSVEGGIPPLCFFPMAVSLS